MNKLAGEEKVEIQNLLAIRAGLAMISKNAQVIRDCEEVVIHKNADKTLFENKKKSEYENLLNEFEEKKKIQIDKITSIREEKYLIPQIANGKAAPFYEKESIEEVKNSAPAHPGVSVDTIGNTVLFFVGLLGVIIFILTCYFNGNIDNTAWSLYILTGSIICFGVYIYRCFKSESISFLEIFSYCRQASMYKKHIKKCEKMQSNLNKYRKIYNEFAKPILVSEIKKLETMKAEQEIELKDKAQLNKTEIAEFFEMADVEIDMAEENKNSLLKNSREIADSLNENYPWYSETDWGNIDLVIYYLQTGRADTLKEALVQVDRQRQTDQITRCLDSSKEYISRLISFSSQSVVKAIKEGICGIGSTVARYSQSIAQTMKDNARAMGEYLESVTDSQKQLGAMVSKELSLNNILQEKANETSQELLNDLRYQQRYWVK